MHHRHLIYRLIHDLRRFGGGVIAWTLLLFIFAIFVFWPLDALLGHGAGSSAVTVAIGALIVSRIKRRHPGFTVDTPAMSRVYLATAIIFVAGTVVLFVYSYLTTNG